MDNQTWETLTSAERDKQRDISDLDSRFDNMYHTGERIEVVYKWGDTVETKRGYVGRTTGWKPIYILINNTRSLGSSDILDKNVIEIRCNVSSRKRR